MWNFIRKFRVSLLFSFLFLFSFYLLSSYDFSQRSDHPVSRAIIDLLAPILDGIDSISDNIQQTWEEYIAIRDARRENRRLKKELTRIKSQISELTEYQQENERLRSLLFLKTKIPAKMISAEVIGKDSTRWSQTILINKGRSDHLVKNLAISTHEGVVGHIIEVARTAAKVLLISDINSSVSAIVQRNRIQGIVVGRGDGLCRVKFLSNIADIHEGDLMVTSGFGGIYPKGLIVGCLQNILKKPTGLFLEAELVPDADLSRLEEVLIVMKNSE